MEELLLWRISWVSLRDVPPPSVSVGGIQSSVSVTLSWLTWHTHHADAYTLLSQHALPYKSFLHLYANLSLEPNTFGEKNYIHTFSFFPNRLLSLEKQYTNSLLEWYGPYKFLALRYTRWWNKEFSHSIGYFSQRPDFTGYFKHCFKTMSVQQ